MTKYNQYAFLFFAVAGIFSCACGMDQEKKHISKSAEFAKNLAIGSVTGIAEVVADQPLISMKNSLQQGKGALGIAPGATMISFKKALNPRVLYRGFGVNIAGMAPTIAVINATNEALAYAFTKKDTKTRAANAALAGGLSSLVSSPIEMVILHQGNTGKNVFNTIKQLLAEGGFGVMARGITPKAGRESIWGAGFLVAYPLVEKQVQTHITDNKLAVIVLSAAIAGGGTAFVSHPCDTLSTFMQADLKKQQAKNTLQAAKIIYNGGGLKAFYKGLMPRTTRVCLAIPLMHYVKNGLIAYTSPKGIQKH